MISLEVPKAAALKIQRLARARREKPRETVERFWGDIQRMDPIISGGETKEIKVPMRTPPLLGKARLAGKINAFAQSLPALVRRTDGPPPIHLEFGSDEDGDHWVRLPNGRVLYEHCKVLPRTEALFEFVQDKLPSNYGVRDYHLAVIVQQRYLKYLDQHENFGMSHGAGFVVDAGAFVGIKAIAMLDVGGPSCRGMAIEMESENFRLLQKNIRENGLEERLTAVPAAISDREGSAQHYKRGFGMMGNSVVPVELGLAIDGATVQTTTLEKIFSEHGITEIDYLNIQLNGAEPNAMRGLGKYADRVKTYFIATPYAVGGVPVRDQVVQALEKSGHRPIDDKPGRVIARR